MYGSRISPQLVAALFGAGGGHFPQAQANPHAGYGFGGVSGAPSYNAQLAALLNPSASGQYGYGGVGDVFQGVGDMLVGDQMSPEDAVLASLVSGGPVDIIGDDIIGDLLVGAAKAGNPRAAQLLARRSVPTAQQSALALLRQKAEQMQLAKAINPNAIDYRQQSYARSGELYLPIVPLLIAGAATGLLVLDPQVPIQVHKIFVPSTTAPFFSFTDIRVGKDSQLIAAGEMPCEGFSEVSVDSNVRLDTCAVGQKIFLSIRNKTADPHTFEGYLKGVVALR